MARPVLHSCIKCIRKFTDTPLALLNGEIPYIRMVTGIATSERIDDADVHLALHTRAETSARTIVARTIFQIWARTSLAEHSITRFAGHSVAWPLPNTHRAPAQSTEAACGSG